MQLTCTFEVNATTYWISRHLQDFSEATQPGFTIQINGISDLNLGDGSPNLYSGFKYILPVCGMSARSEDNSLGRKTCTVTFDLMNYAADSYGRDYILAVWDNRAYAYDATTV
jgi:hypothetical protein